MDLSRFAPSVRGARLYLMYGTLAFGQRILEWPESRSIDWRFWVGGSVAALLTWKALQTSSPVDQPHDEPKPKKPDQNGPPV